MVLRISANTGTLSTSVPSRSNTAWPPMARLRPVAIDEPSQGLDHVADMIRRQAGKQSQPQGPFGHYVGVGQVAHDAEVATFHIGLTDQVAAEEKPRGDLVLVEELDQ